MEETDGVWDRFKFLNFVEVSQGRMQEENGLAEGGKPGKAWGRGRENCEEGAEKTGKA